MAELQDHLVICSVEQCLGPQGEWLPSDKAAAKLYQMMGGRLMLETSGPPSALHRLYRQLDLDTPALCWGGDLLYSFASENICGGASLPGSEMRALVRDLLEAFPGAAISILTANGGVYLPRINRLAHAQLKKEECAYLLSELDSIPLPWYRVTLFAAPALFGRIRMYLSEKSFQEYRCCQRDASLQFSPLQAGREESLTQLWQDWDILPQNTLWLGCKTLSQEILQKIEPPIAAYRAEEAVRAAAQRRLPAAHEGCLGETLYSLCKG